MIGLTCLTREMQTICTFVRLLVLEIEPAETTFPSKTIVSIAMFGYQRESTFTLSWIFQVFRYFTKCPPSHNKKHIPIQTKIGAR
jgi:hypothetical protein